MYWPAFDLKHPKQVVLASILNGIPLKALQFLRRMKRNLLDLTYQALDETKGKLHRDNIGILIS